MNDIIVQALGLGISVSLCFLGYANLKWVRRIGILSYVLTALQAVFLNRPAVLVMNAINLAYYLAVTFEEKVPVIASKGAKIGALAVATGAACIVQYGVLAHSVLSPATFAILGGATGLVMAISERFHVLKMFTVANVACWSTYCILTGAYTNLIGNAFILAGVVVAYWRHYRKPACVAEKQ